MRPRYKRRPASGQRVPVSFLELWGISSVGESYLVD